MNIISGAEDELLDGVLLLCFHLRLKLIFGLGNEKAPSAFGSVILDDHRPVDIICSFKPHGNIYPGPEKPLPLHLPVALPGQNAPVSKGGNGQRLKLLDSQILNQRAVRNDDHILGYQIIGIIQEGLVALYGEELVRLCLREGIVEPGRLTDADPDGFKALHARPMENLQAAVRANGSNGKVVLIVSLQNLLNILFGNHGDDL